MGLRWLGVCGVVVIAVWSVGARSAWASPHSLAVSYPYATLEDAEVAVVQSVDLRSHLHMNDEKQLNPRFSLLSAYEYGISERVEIGLYMALEAPHDAPITIDGMRQRLRIRLSDANRLPIDVAFNFEVVEYRYALAIEETTILQKRFGVLTLVANSTLEEELAGYRPLFALSISQTVGFDVEILPHVHLGAEYWLRAVLYEEEHDPDNRAAVPEGNEDLALALRYQNFLGPAVSLQWHRFWWTTSLSLRLDSVAGQVIERPDVNERAYERLHLRSMFGLIL